MKKDLVGFVLLIRKKRRVFIKVTIITILKRKDFMWHKLLRCLNNLVFSTFPYLVSREVILIIEIWVFRELSETVDFFSILFLLKSSRS